MQKRYELWLDESGSFEDEDNTERLPSLVGGILIESTLVNEHQLASYIKNGQGHACELHHRKGEIVMPALRYITKHGGHLVYFENKERETQYSSRELYLRILARGIIHILRQLSATEDSFSLDVLIALRVDIEERAKSGEQLIPMEDYLQEVNEYVRSALKLQTVALSASYELNLYIGSARREYKLMFADFACNSRLTRNSNGFTPEEKEELQQMFEPEYLFTLNEKLTDSWVKMYLAEDDVASALYELYTTPEQIDRSILLDLIMDKLEEMSYRVTKIQLRGFLNEIQNDVQMEHDFERSEALLKRIIDEVLPHLRNKNAHTHEFEFRIYISLADMYLREGDILQAKEPLQGARQAARRLSKKMKYLLIQYQMIEKEALYDIACFNYSAGAKKMQEVAVCIGNMLDILGCEPLISNNLNEHMRSEYLGDALCMKLYANMFLQREHPALYDEMCKDSDCALLQYQFAGELERHQQYRAHIEMEQGNYETAFDWLMKSEGILNKNLDQSELAIKFLNKAMQEDALSRNFYAMYYIELMEEAKLHHKDDLADRMYQALLKQSQLLGILQQESEPHQSNPVEIGEHVLCNRMDILEEFCKQEELASYHPMEIVYWKLGSYQAWNGKLSASYRWFEKALNVCDKSPEYTLPKIVSLGIISEEIFHRANVGEDIRPLITKLRKRYFGLLKLDLPKTTRQYVEQWSILLREGQKEQDISELAWKLSRKITF